jgi:hypothetical protein
MERGRKGVGRILRESMAQVYQGRGKHALRVSGSEGRGELGGSRGQREGAEAGLGIKEAGVCGVLRLKGCENRNPCGIIKSMGGGGGVVFGDMQDWMLVQV